MARKKQTGKWAPPPWPWGVELMTLAFFLFAVGAPGFFDRFFVEEAQLLAQPSWPNLDTLQIRHQFLGGAFVAILYVAHICWAVSTTEHISLSASHLFAPTVFAGGAFLRMMQHSHYIGYADRLFARPGLQVAILLIGVQAITFLIARRRMLQVWRRFEGQDWDLVVGPHRDGSWLKLMLSRLQPIFYPPHSFRACPEGILIEGYSFAMPISFEEIETVFPVAMAPLSSPGTYLASSANDLVGIKLYEEDAPFYISPQKPDRFFAYCHDRISIRSYAES